VNRDSGTESANPGWLQRLVRQARDHLLNISGCEPESAAAGRTTAPENSAPLRLCGKEQRKNCGNKVTSSMQTLKAA